MLVHFLSTGSVMNKEDEVLQLMESTRAKYFSELNRITFQIEKNSNIKGIAIRVIFGSFIKILLYYSDDRVLNLKYRMGLVPVIGHELAHLIDPVNPERVMAERLPVPMMQLWNELREAGLAQCSMDG